MKINRRFTWSRLCGAGAILTLAVVSIAGSAAAQQQNAPPLPQAQSPGQPGLGAQGILREQHGDWQVRCEAAAGPGAKQCALLQNIESAVRQGFGLVVMVFKTHDDKTKMRVAAPHGVFLPKGLELRVDGEVIGTAPFLYCHRSACRTEATLTEPIVKVLANGKEALFVLYESPQKGTGLIVSLNGFTAGLTALPKWSAPVDASAGQTLVPGGANN